MQDAQIPGIAHGVTCYSAPEVKKVAYKQIWREIDSLEASIRALKTRHNSLSITARLPPEILSEIFDWTATMLRNKSSRWIRTSFVCSHWRRVALECPKLWRRVNCHTSPERLRVLLPRTGAVPLEIYFPSVTKSSAVGFLQVLQEMYRVRELRLGSYSRGTWQSMELVLPHLTQPAPLLETFSVASTKPEYSQLPDNLFAGHAPRLRTLKLIGCIVPNTSPVLTNITSLKLRGSSQAPQISLAELLIMLESLSNIQALELTRIHRSESVVPPGRTVHLPYLHHLVISYDQATCAALLSCLKYPITATQTIRTRYGAHLDGLRSLGVILAMRTRPIAYVQVYKLPRVRLVFKCWEGAGTRLHLPADDPHINIEVGSLISSLKPLRAVWQALPMAGLESLFISGNFADDAYFGDFGNLSSLKTVRVEDAAVKFLRALKQGLPECGLENNDAFPFSQLADSPSRLSFRPLRTLVLGGHFVHLGKMGIREATEFTNCFRERRKRGVPLRKLYISKYLPREGKDGEITDIFRTVVKEVHWGLYDSGLGCGLDGYYNSGESSEVDQDSEEEDTE